MEKLQIGKKEIGRGRKCFVIAEAGVNHNGKIALAKRLVDAAFSAGADAVKFQLFEAEEIATKKAPVMKYAEKNSGRGGSQLEMLKKLELKKSDFIELKKYCEKKGIIFLCTPHSSMKDVDFLESMGIAAYKIGSGDLCNIPFLKAVAEKGRPVFLSTGMADMEEARQAVEAVRNAGNEKIVVMHCTTQYPCPLEDANLRIIPQLEKELNAHAGYSDHTLSTIVPALAAALGACVIEKHFTLDRKMKGPDHKASLEPKELKEAIENIRKAETALGSPEKKPTESEKESIAGVRKSLVAAHDIEKGTELKEQDLAAKRPGTGISPARINEIIGKKAKRRIAKDELFSLGDFE